MAKREGGLHKSPQHMVSVTTETHAKLKQAAKQRSMTLGDLIAAMLDREEATN